MTSKGGVECYTSGAGNCCDVTTSLTCFCCMELQNCEVISGFDVFLVFFNSLVDTVMATRLISFYGVCRHVVLV